MAPRATTKVAPSPININFRIYLLCKQDERIHFLAFIALSTLVIARFPVTSFSEFDKLHPRSF